MAGGIDNQKVLIGAPDQSKTTGAIMRAPLGTALPGSIDAAMPETLDDAFVGCGYINEDGLSITPDMSTKDILDWSQQVVRKIVESFTNEVAWKHLETSKESLENYFGEDNVEVLAAANASHGTQLLAKLNKAELPRCAWIARIKDGKQRVLVVLPDAQVTGREAIEFKGSDPTTWGVTLTTYEDEDGNHAYIYTDDGLVTTV